MQLPEPTIPTAVELQGNQIMYYPTRGEKQHITNGDTLMFVGDTHSARNIRELTRGETYRFVSTDPDNVILEHMNTQNRVLVFKETFVMAFRNGYFSVD